MPDDVLRTSLLDLLGELRARGHGFPLILGGGYGLYLKQLELQRVAGTVRTVLPGELWPVPRSTEDLDVFLPTEIVADVGHMRAVRAALDALGYAPVVGVEYMHFEKRLAGDSGGGSAGRVKIDMLTGPVDDPAVARRLRIKRPRVRPREAVELHAYLTDGALSFDQAPEPLAVAGRRSDGTAATETVHLPPAFTFLLMKLHAFHDRRDDAGAGLGQHHALDLYRIVAMLTEAEYTAVGGMVAAHAAAPAVARARAVVAEDFGDPHAIGVLRLREHELFSAAMDADTFRTVLRELLPPA